MVAQPLRTPDEGTRLLSLVDIFESLSPEEVMRLPWQRHDVYLERGCVLRAEEGYDGKLFALRKGRVRLYKTAPDGREFTLAVVGAGTVFGELVPAVQTPQMTCVRAIEPSRISVMRAEDLERLVLERPEVGLRIARLLNERLRQCEVRLEDAVLKGVSARLASLILLLIESEGVVTAQGYLKIPTHYTHRQLGAMIGAKREVVTRAFAQLQDEGAVELRRRLIHVKSLDLVKRVAGRESAR